MKIFWRLAGSALLVLSCWTTTAWAETRYISDQLVVSLREQPENNAQPVTYLRTDMPVKVLEETADYVKVQTEAGEVGYIKSSYLTPQKPKSAIINQLQKERDRLAGKVKEIQQQVTEATSLGDESQQELAKQLTDMRQQATELQKKLVTTQTALTETSNEYQALQKDAKNVVAITKERDQLRKANLELATAVANQKEETDALMTSGLIKWFLAGAGVLFLGWVIGRMSGGRRRRSTF